MSHPPDDPRTRLEALPGNEDELRQTAEARALLRKLPAISHGAHLRVGSAVRRSLRAERASRSRLTWVLAPAGVVASAAVLALGVWCGVRLAQPQPVPLSESLASDEVWQSASVANGVSLSFEGTGAVSGDSLHPRIAWDRGVVNVEVTPGLGIDLRVGTREADVRVVGTGFSVRRDALGTEVKVVHGRVEVVCSGADPVFVDPGQTQDCLPTSAAGLLGRARAIEASGAGADDVLAATAAGLARAGAEDAAVRDELTVMQIHQLLRAGRLEDGGVVADAYLASPSAARRLDVVRMVAAARLEHEGCAGAMDLLDAAASAPGHDEGDLAVRDGCRARLHAE